MKTERTAVFLMANLGSEMVQCLDARARGQREQAHQSAERARNIINQLEARSDLGGGKQEIEILRKILEDAFSTKPDYQVGEQELNNYFLPFAQRVLTN